MNPVLPKLKEMKKKNCTKPKLSLRVELCLKGGRSVWNQTELNTLVCIAGLRKVASEVCATHPNILQLSREGECMHECEEKQILWPVGPPLQHVPVNGSQRQMAASVMRACVNGHFAYLTTNYGFQESSFTEAKGSAVMTKLQLQSQHSRDLTCMKKQWKNLI